jgi:AraC family L-rhamnose operon transcriptional activator RhaR/AraC family L-rhamnose operon regulatory protein RhaS
MITTLTAANHFRGQLFPLQVLRSDPQGPFPFHCHEFDELVVVTGGSGIYKTDNSTVHIVAGDIFAVQTGEGHGYIGLQRLRLLNVIFQATKIDLPLRLLEKMPVYLMLFHLEPKYRQAGGPSAMLHVPPEILTQITTLLAQLEAELAHRIPGYEATAVGELLQLFGLLARAYEQFTPPPSFRESRMGEVLSTIHRRYREHLTVRELADLAGLSPSQLSRLFQEVMHTSPINYLITYRIQQAAELLRQTTWDITEIALEMGFNDGNYLSRQFKSVMGISPQAYRKALCGHRRE